MNAMGRLATFALAGVIAAMMAATTPALAAARRPTSSGAARDRISLEVVIDIARTPDGARDMLDRVADHGLRDFRIERDRHHSFELERPFDGLIPALREVRMLHRDGIRAHLELVR